MTVRHFTDGWKDAHIDVLLAEMAALMKPVRDLVMSIDDSYVTELAMLDDVLLMYRYAIVERDRLLSERDKLRAALGESLDGHANCIDEYGYCRVPMTDARIAELRRLIE